MTATTADQRGRRTLAISDTRVYRIARDEFAARPHDRPQATIATVRNEIIRRWMASAPAAHRAGVRCVRHLGLECPAGRLLRNALINPKTRAGGSDERAIAAVCLIDGAGERRVRMANRAVAVAHSVNGITPRRRSRGCGPAPTAPIREAIGSAFLDDAQALTVFSAFADDASFRERFAAVKRSSKVKLAGHIKDGMCLRIGPAAMLGVRSGCPRAYKRQLPNIIETVALYHRIGPHPARRVRPFAGKAPSGGHNARLVNDLRRRIGADSAAGVPEQIPTAGTPAAGREASGTGSMRFAPDSGTLGGANIEIMEHVGRDHIVIFGLAAAAVAARRANGDDPRAAIAGSGEPAQGAHATASGAFPPGDPDRYGGLRGGLYDGDRFMVAADFEGCAAVQRHVDARGTGRQGWRRSAALDVADKGRFSSGRTIGEDAHDGRGVT